MAQYGLVLINIMCMIVIFKFNEMYFKEKFSVNTIFMLSLLGSFGLSLLNLIDYIDLNYWVVLIIILDIIFFYFGGYFAKVRISRKVSEPRQSNSLAFLDPFINITSIIGLLGILLLMYNFTNNFSLSYMITNPAILQKNFQTVQFIGYFNTLNIIVLPLITYRYFMKGNIKLIHIVMILISIIGLLLAGNKTYIMVSTLSSFAVYSRFYSNGFRVMRNALFIVIIIIIFFVWYERNIDIGVYNSNLPWWHSPYNYIAGSWRALGELINQPQEDGLFGNLTFYFLYKILSLFTDITKGSYIMEEVYIPEWFNVYSYNGEIFKDFGYLGIILFSFLLGLVSNKLQVSFKQKKDVFTCLLYSMFFSGLVLAFFVNVFIQAYFILNILYILSFKFALMLLSKKL